MTQNANVEFEEKAVKTYIDDCITFWRKKRDEEGDMEKAPCYIDAFQSMRMSIFGETLPPTVLPEKHKN